jgi:hypothetical protein
MYPEHRHWVKENDKWIVGDICTNCPNIGWRIVRILKKELAAEIAGRVSELKSKKFKPFELETNKELNDLLDYFGLNGDLELPDIQSLQLKPKIHPMAARGYINFMARK